MLSPFEKGRRAQPASSLFDARPAPAPEEPADPPQARQCSGCGAPYSPEHWRENMDVCPGCGKHERMPARRRLEITVDPGTFEELPLPRVVADPLRFPDYERKLEKSREASGLPDALVAGFTAIGGHKTALGIMDPVFMMGSMGAAVGEGLSALSDEALKRKLPMVVFCCSGGARMQEGMVSLMQMAKVSMSVERLAAKKLPFITVLTDPTTGGVTASFASLGDIILAEPDACIGFTGMRVIKQTLRQELPEGFQKAEFMLEHGFVDIVLPRRDIPWTLGKILRLHGF